MRLSHTLVTCINEAHSQLCMGVGLNNIHKRYRLLWLSGTKKTKPKKIDGSGLGFRFGISVRARARVGVKYVD